MMRDHEMRIPLRFSKDVPYEGCLPVLMSASDLGGIRELKARPERLLLRFDAAILNQKDDFSLPSETEAALDRMNCLLSFYTLCWPTMPVRPEGGP